MCDSYSVKHHTYVIYKLIEIDVKIFTAKIAKKWIGREHNNWETIFDFYKKDTKSLIKSNLSIKEKAFLYELFNYYDKKIINNEVFDKIYENSLEIVNKHKNKKQFVLLKKNLPFFHSFIKKNSVSFEEFFALNLSYFIYSSLTGAKFYIDDLKNEFNYNAEECCRLSDFIENLYVNFDVLFTLNHFYFSEENQSFFLDRPFLKKIIYSSILKLDEEEIVILSTKKETTSPKDSESKISEASESEFSEDSKKINKKHKTVKFISSCFSINQKSLGNLFLLYEPFLKKTAQYPIIGGFHFSTNHRLFNQNHKKFDTKLHDNLSIFIGKFSKVKINFDKSMFDTLEQYIKNKYSSDELDSLDKLRLKLSEYSYMRFKKPDGTKNLQKIQKKFSELSNIWLFLNLKKKIDEDDMWDNDFYYSFYFDFRGRNYIKSLISPYGPIIFRFIFFYGYITKKKLNDSYKPTSLINVDKFKKERAYIEQKFSIDCSSDSIFKPILWVAKSLGKIYKSEISEIQEAQTLFNEKSCIHSDVLIEIGLKKLFEFLSYSDEITIFEKEKGMNEKDIIEVIYYVKLIKSFKNENIPRRFIALDTTASVMQHMGKLLGYKDDNALNYTNINSGDYWYDTYEPVIKELIKNNPNSTFLRFYKRSILKKVIMVRYYNAKEYTSRKYFFKAIKEVSKETENFIPNDDYYLLKEEFAIIFQNLNNVETAIFFKKSSKTFTSEVSGYKVLLEDFEVDLRYYVSAKGSESSNERIIVYYKKKEWQESKRFTLVDYKYNKEELDTKKTATAALPNTVHALDALYSRRIIKRLDTPIICIHDAFLVPFDLVEDAILIANEEIRHAEIITKEVNKETKELKTFSKNIFI